MDKFKQAQPDVMKATDALTEVVYKDSALSGKIKRLIALAVALRVGCTNCILAQSKLALLVKLDKYVKVITGTRGKAITEKGLVCEGPDGKQTLYEGETIVCAARYRSLTSVVEQMWNTAPEFYYIGDCVRPQAVKEAIRSGYDTAIDL